MSEPATLDSPREGDRRPRSRVSSGARLLTLIALPLAGVLAMMVGVATGVAGDQLTILALAIATMVIGLAPIAVANTRDNGHILIGFVGIVFAAYFAFPAIFRYIPARGPEEPGSMGGQVVMPEDVIAAQWVVLAGLVSLLIGYALPFASQLASRYRTSSFEWSTRSTIVVAFGMVTIGWLLTIASSVLGNVSLFQSGFVATLATAQLFGLGMLYVLWFRRRSRAALFALLTFVPVSVLFGLLTGSKLQALNPAAIVIMTHIILRRKLAWRWVALSLLALVLIYPLNRFYQDYIVGAARTSPLEVLTNPDVVVSGFGRFLSDARVGEYVSSGFEASSLRLDMLGVLSVLVRDTPSRVSYQYGKTFAALLVAPIPRFLWPGKPDNSVGLWITKNYSHGLESHTAPTQVGEFYINFGIAGVIGGLLLLGLILRFVHESLVSRPTVPTTMAVLIFMYFLCVKFESAIAQQYANILFALGPLVVVHVGVRLFQGRSASSPTPSAAMSENALTFP